MNAKTPTDPGCPIGKHAVGKVQGSVAWIPGKGYYCTAAVQKLVRADKCKLKELNWDGTSTDYPTGKVVKYVGEVVVDAQITGCPNPQVWLAEGGIFYIDLDKGDQPK